MTKTPSTSTEEQARGAPPASPPAGRNGDGAGNAAFTPVRHVYEPNKTGLPPLGPYVRDAWRRRQFAVELARTNLRAKHFNTALGQLWLVLNGLLLGGIYFILVSIVGRGDKGIVFLGHLLAALFTFRFVSTCVSQGARSVVGGGQLILNSAFPRVLLPVSAVLAAFIAFLPTALVYAVLHVVLDLPVGPELLWLVPVFALVIVFASGAAMLIAAAQVYFRDLKSFLPYFTRMWLYSSPILYYVSEIPEGFRPILAVNPLYPMLDALSGILDAGRAPSPGLLLWGAAWALAAFVAGALFFISREREFAVRL